MSNVSHLFELPLPGLREDNPRDFLAALGLLRLIDELWPECETTLRWHPDTLIPQLSSDRPLPDDWTVALVASLLDLVQRPEKPIAHGEIIKTDYESFRDATRRAVGFAETGHPLANIPQFLYSCYASPIPSESGDVEPSGFSFGNGQSGKKLLLDVTQLIERINAPELLATLQGKAHGVSAKTLRWNPVEYRPAAYRSHDPGSKNKGDDTLDFPALNVLAFFGMTFYPVVETASGMTTTGIFRLGRQSFFLWPTWPVSLRLMEISSLLVSDLSTLGSETGAERIWRARRFSSDKSLYFAPAEIHR